MDFRQTYKYSGSERTNLTGADMNLGISLFEHEIHFALKLQGGYLINYEIYRFEGNPNQTSIEQLFYKWISLHGKMPSAVKCTICTGEFQLLPAIGFNEKNVRSLNIFTENYATISLANIGDHYQLVYPQKESFRAALFAVFNNCTDSHYLQNVCSELLGHQGLPSNVVYLHIMYDKICILCLVDDKLQCVVEQSFVHENDVLYFTLLVMQNYDLKPDACPVFIGGFVASSSRLIKFLSDYIHVVQYLSLDSFSHLAQIPDIYEDAEINL